MKNQSESLPRQSSPRPGERTAESGRQTPRRAGHWDNLWIILGSGLYLFVSLFTLRGTPFLLGGDQVYFWLYAQRMIAGEHVYRGFLQFTPPGTDLVYVGAFLIFGQHIWVTNLVALVLGVALSWVCFHIGRAFLSRWQAMLAAWLFLVAIYGKVLIATHHWYSALAVLAAIAVLIPERTRARIALAGALLGVAMFFTQTRGPAAFAGFAIYLVWEQAQTTRSWRECCKRLILLFVSMSVIWLLLCSYFIATSDIDRMWYWLVTYLLRYHASGRTTFGLPEDSARGSILSYIQVLTVYLLLPIVYAASLWSAWRERRNPTPADNIRLLLTLTGLAITLEVAMSPNWLRVYCATAPGILLLIWMVSRLQRFQRYATVLLWAVVICAACWGTLSRRRVQNTTVQLPAGQTATNKIAAQKLEWIAQHTAPGDFFFQAPWPGVYLPLQLRDPAFADGFLPMDETRPELVADGIQQIEAKRVRYILWSPRLNTPFLPDRPETYHLVPFREYMVQHYKLVMTFPDQDEIWERL